MGLCLPGLATSRRCDRSCSLLEPPSYSFKTPSALVSRLSSGVCSSVVNVSGDVHALYVRLVRPSAHGHFPNDFVGGLRIELEEGCVMTANSIQSLQPVTDGEEI